MSCKPINLSAEQVRMRLLNKDFLWDLSIDDSVDDIKERIKFVHKGLVIPETNNPQNRYTFYGAPLAKRVSDKPHKVYESHVGRIRAEKEQSSVDNIIKRNGGAKAHLVMKELIDCFYNNNGKIEDIRKRASQGPLAIEGKNFDSLNKLARFIIAQIESKQSEINTKEKATIFVETGVVDPIINEGGTMDVFALFSNGKGAIYDFKTITSSKRSYEKRAGDSGALIGKLENQYGLESYEMSISEYKRVMKDVYGVKDIIESRAIPIHVRYKFKDGLTNRNFKDKNTLKPEFEVIEAGEYVSEFLKQIPLAGEKTKYEGLNALLEKQHNMLNDLENRLQNKKLSSEEYDRVVKRIKNLSKGIQNTIVKGDIQDIVLSAHQLVNTLGLRLYEQRLNNDGTPNLKYLEDAELSDLLAELKVYEDIIAYTDTYFGDLKKNNRDLYDTLKLQVDALAARVQHALVSGQKVFEDRILDLVQTRYKDEAGNILPTEELTFFQSTFNRFSEIDHPVFRTAWELLQSAQYEHRKKLSELDEDIHQKQDALFKWAKENGLSRQGAFDKIINRDTAKLYSEVDEKLWEAIDSAYESENIDFLKKVFEIRDVKEFNRLFLLRAEQRVASLKADYNNLDPLIAEDGTVLRTTAELTQRFKDDLKAWVQDNDITKYSQAWLKETNRGYFKLKDAVREANFSEEYKYIKANKPLLDYYNMYVKYNRTFRELLGIKSYWKLPDNFIAYIRKDFVDHLTQDSFNIGAALNELVGDFRNVREEDIYIADRDESGNLRKNIPLLFLQPFRNKKGDVDNTQQSYDLSTSLLLFGKMAYHYNYMHEIEPKIQGLKQLLGDSTPERPGTQVKDSLGRKVKGYLQDFATQKGIDTDTYKLFEDLTDLYLYGIKFKEKNIKGDLIKIISKLKQYNSKRALGFAVIPGMGALIAGKTATYLEGKKGQAFTSSQSRQSYLKSAREYKNYKALSLFFDVYAEDPIDRWAENLKANLVGRVATTRNMFYPLRKADELMNDHVLNAMAYNYGVTADGKLVRLNEPGKNYEGVKSIAESFTIDKDGKVVIPNITKESFIQFRNAVRSTMSNIIGSLSQQDAARYDTNLIINLIMQFKTWMPGIIRERVGKLRYDENIMGLKWGRFNAIFDEFKPLTDSEKEAGSKIVEYMTGTFLPSFGKLLLDLSTFGLAPKLGLGRVNMPAAKRRFREWQMADRSRREVTFEQFLEIKEAQIRAGLIEMRVILGMSALILFLGGKAPDEPDKRRWQVNWFSRTAYKAITKAFSEITFVWNPSQFLQMTQNILPMMSLLTNAKTTAFNGFDEIRDMLLGEAGKDPANNTPLGYYGLQWFYGGNQLERFFELYKEFEKSPYLSTGR